jgi:hypothetical protein
MLPLVLHHIHPVPSVQLGVIALRVAVLGQNALLDLLFLWKVDTQRAYNALQIGLRLFQVNGAALNVPVFLIIQHVG